MVPWLDPFNPPYFPDTDTALDEPRGLLAAGGKLSIDWLLVAYRQGIFQSSGTYLVVVTRATYGDICRKFSFE